MANRTTHEEVAAEIRAHLARQGKSQAEMADALGWNGNAVSRRLSGKVPLDVNELAAIADFLGLPVAALLPAAVA